MATLGWPYAGLAMIDMRKHPCQHRPMTEDELRAIVAAYDEAGAQLHAANEERLRVRDEGLRKAKAEGMKQVQIVKITGYSKETVRKALNPQVRQTVNEAKKDRRAAR